MGFLNYCGTFSNCGAFYAWHASHSPNTNRHSFILLESFVFSTPHSFSLLSHTTFIKCAYSSFFSNISHTLLFSLSFNYFSIYMLSGLFSLLKDSSLPHLTSPNTFLFLTIFLYCQPLSSYLSLHATSPHSLSFTLSLTMCSAFVSHTII